MSLQNSWHSLTWIPAPSHPTGGCPLRESVSRSSALRREGLGVAGAGGGGLRVVCGDLQQLRHQTPRAALLRLGLGRTGEGGGGEADRCFQVSTRGVWWTLNGSIFVASFFWGIGFLRLWLQNRLVSMARGAGGKTWEAV